MLTSEWPQLSSTAAPIPHEWNEARSLIQWAHYMKWRGHRISELLVMIPNGANLAGTPKVRGFLMHKLKLAGFRNGVFDYLLTVPLGGYAGLWIELKRTKRGVVSEEQKRFFELQRSLGYSCQIANGWEVASRCITAYLALSTHEVIPLGFGVNHKEII